MGPSLRRFPLVFIAIACLGAGVIDDGSPTDLPISPNAGLPAMSFTPGDVMPFTDAGVLWVAPEDADRHQGDADAGATNAGARRDGGTAVLAVCAEIARRIEHRRSLLLSLGLRAAEVGPAQALHLYCQEHASDPECSRPPAVSDQDVSEAIDADGSTVDSDAWLVRWRQALEACQGR